MIELNYKVCKVLDTGVTRSKLPTLEEMCYGIHFKLDVIDLSDSLIDVPTNGYTFEERRIA